jgi:hypothetical protein
MSEDNGPRMSFPSTLLILSTAAGVGASLAMLAQNLVLGEYWQVQIEMSAVSVVLALMYLARTRHLGETPRVAQRVLAWTLITAPVAWYAATFAFAMLYVWMMKDFH